MKTTPLTLKAIAIACLTLCSNSWAVAPFAVKDIQTQGLVHFEENTILGNLPFKVGDTYTDEKSIAAIKSLMTLGIFKDVQIKTQDDGLTVVVQERPTISKVEFIGIKEFDKEGLVKAARELGLADGRPFDKSLVDKVEQELKRQYLSRSLYSAEITTTITPIANNRVNLSFSVNEGSLVKIKTIRIKGNSAFSESTLRNLFDSDTTGFLSWYTKSDRYAKNKINADLEALRSFYLARGYLDFKVKPPKIDVSTDKKEINLDIELVEGAHYTVSQVELTGNFLNKNAIFEAKSTIHAGDEYNFDKLNETSQAMTAYLGQFGFAFAKISTILKIDRERNTVVVVFQSEPGARAYVRRIQILGNQRTRDEVIRREFRQLEASWYDGEKISASRDRVDRLGFFKDVQISTQEVPNAPDLVDIVLTVVEKPTGNISAGAGYSSSDKLTLQFGLQQDNVFGSGQFLGFDVNTSKLNRAFSITNTNPYLTKEGISRTADLYYKTSTASNATTGDYSIKTAGTSVRFGVPVTERDVVFAGIGIEQNKIADGNNMPQIYKDHVKEFGATSRSLPLTLGWSRDERDSATTPNSGTYQRLHAEWSPAGDVHYIKATAQYQKYIPLNKQFTFAFNTELNWGKGLGARSFPVFKNTYSGGLGSVRGFQQSSLGPLDLTNQAPLGGPKRITLNTEFITPFPGAGNDRSLRLFGFVDVGNVYGEKETVDLSLLRASTGVGLSWISPIGPLRIAYAKPLRTQPTDKTQKFQFQIGTSF